MSWVPRTAATAIVLLYPALLRLRLLARGVAHVVAALGADHAVEIA